MNNEHKQAFKNLFDYIYKGDVNATLLSFDILTILHTWDDLIDGDKVVTNKVINDTFLAATVKLTLNPLWTPDLANNLMSVYLRWQAANKIESTIKDENELSKAWMLRAGLYDLFVLIAAKLYGLDWAEQISSTVYATYGEKLTDFIQEIQNA